MLRDAGLPGQIVGAPIMFDAVFTADDVHEYRATLRADQGMQKRFNAILRQRGVLKGESKYYVSTAHTDADVAHTLDAFAAAVAAERK